LDEVLAAEARQMAREGYEPLLKKTRWCVLKRKDNLTPQQKFRLRDLLRYNLRTVRAYLLKEDFQQFWKYNSPTHFRPCGLLRSHIAKCAMCAPPGLGRLHDFWVSPGSMSDW
jgi:hypothetical protein